MRKILLVIDEYQELVGIENVLRRVGFDVLSVGKDILVADAIVGFVPEIVISTLKGRSVDAAKVAFRLAKLYPSPRLAVITSLENVATLTSAQKDFIDGVIALPVNPVALIRTVAQLGQLEAAPLVEKYQKLSAVRAGESKAAETVRGDSAPAAPAEKTTVVRGAEPQPSAPPADRWDPVRDRGQAANLRTSRSDRYEAFLAELNDHADKTIPKDKLSTAMKKLKRDSESEAESLKQIDTEKREFVRVLYEEGVNLPSDKNEKKK